MEQTFKAESKNCHKEKRIIDSIIPLIIVSIHISNVGFGNTNSRIVYGIIICKFLKMSFIDSHHHPIMAGPVTAKSSPIMSRFLVFFITLFYKHSSNGNVFRLF